jgi:hypothetical protein
MADEKDFMVNMLRNIQTGIAGLGEWMDKIEERMANLEKRQTASFHFEQSVLSHLTSIHESQDLHRAEMVAMDRRVAGLEKR